MHRTTTLATLLVTVAVSGLTGCVTVQRPPAAGPSAAAPASTPESRADGDPQSQVVQAPAREALERVGPRQRSQSSAPAPRQAAPRSLAPARRAQPDAVPRPPRPQSRRPHQPRIEIPDVSGTVRGNPDLCALGRTYGGWRAGSPESAICEQTYGR
ncbi:hypothetical protein FNH09_31390 [Streptomyces adustus]|uniref:Lipoprotein n=1 Tax=Streptomyces adustus TaxID=1609272 RepID=A0A5N8VNF8_9ACTN|nr:hypothetical protein [Streptomyces adustus]